MCGVPALAMRHATGASFFMEEFKEMRRWCAVAAVLAAALVVWTFTSGQGPANAQTGELPPMFEAGARLGSPLGPLEVREVRGVWLRVKLLGPGQARQPEHWVCVPAQSGGWYVWGGAPVP
jgi:hypothetical protein